MIQRCVLCAEHNIFQQKEPLRDHELPGRPWQKIAADLFEIGEQQFLLIADYYSKMQFVNNMIKITSSACIDFMKSVLIFAFHGIPFPDELITDNGRQFASGEFQRFKDAWGMWHYTSYPFYPQSNGFIEQIAQIVKKTFEKCKISKSDPCLALPSLRSTPMCNKAADYCGGSGTGN